MIDFLSLVQDKFTVAHFVPVNEILLSGNRDYLDLIPRGGSRSAEEFRSWFFANARQFNGGGDGSGMSAVRTFLSNFGHRQKDAFLTTQTLAKEDNFLCWEGYAWHASLPVQTVIHHSWNTAGDVLVDVTWARGKENHNIYLGVPVAHDILKQVQMALTAGGELFHGPIAFLSWALQGQARLTSSEQDQRRTA